MGDDSKPIGHRWQYVLSATIGILAIVVAAAVALMTNDSGGSPNPGTTTTTDGKQTTVLAPSCPLDLVDEESAGEPPDPERPPGDLPDDALVCEILVEGRGEAASIGDTVTFHYVGKLANGRVVANSWDRDDPVSITLGQRGDIAIAGWHEGLVGVKGRERRRLELGHEKAYGVEGSDNGAVPPRAPVAFEIAVVRVDFASGSG